MNLTAKQARLETGQREKKGRMKEGANWQSLISFGYVGACNKVRIFWKYLRRYQQTKFLFLYFMCMHANILTTFEKISTKQFGGQLLVLYIIRCHQVLCIMRYMSNICRRGLPQAVTCSLWNTTKEELRYKDNWYLVLGYLVNGYLVQLLGTCTLYFG